MDDNPYVTVGEKVKAIFAELVGDLSTRLDGSKIAEPAMTAVELACAQEFGAAKARDIGFHMTDWNSDAAFIVAVHLFPERFSREEIAAGIRRFMIHAPSHIRAACLLTGDCEWVDFELPKEPEPDEKPD